MRISALFATLFGCMVAVLPGHPVALAATANAAPRVHTVIIEGMRFQPEGLTVAPGDTVVWRNRDMVPHTATSAAARFDSSEIAPGKSWSYTAATKGEFTYTCTYHPMMKGIVRAK
jgi:plastocyanin